MAVLQSEDVTVITVQKAKRWVASIVERWEPALSLFVVLVLIAVALNLGRKLEGGTKIADALEKVCLWAAALLETLRLAVHFRRWTKPGVPGYSEPKRGLPPLDETEGPGLVFQSPAGVGFPKVRFFVPEESDLKLFVDWSEEDPSISEATDLEPDDRKELYEAWYSVNPRYFLAMQRKMTVGDVWYTTAVSIILALREETYSLLRNKQIAVVKLREKHLQSKPDENKKRYLLYDTLIFEPHFREEHSEFKQWHSLLHFAQFDPPELDAEVTVLIEPDDPRLKLSLNNPWKYGVHHKFKTVDKHVIHEFTLPRRPGERGKIRRFESYWRRVHSMRWTIPVGSLPRESLDSTCNSTTTAPISRPTAESPPAPRPS